MNKTRQTWAFTEDELQRPDTCKAGDMLLLQWDSEDEGDHGGTTGIYVFRNGKASNQYFDGSHGTTEADRQDAEDAFKDRCPTLMQESDEDDNALDEPVEADQFVDVYTDDEGNFLGFAEPRPAVEFEQFAVVEIREGDKPIVSIYNSRNEAASNAASEAGATGCDEEDVFDRLNDEDDGMYEDGDVTVYVVKVRA